MGGIFEASLQQALDPFDPELLLLTISEASGSSLEIGAERAAEALRKSLTAARNTDSPDAIARIASLLRKLPTAPNTSQVREVQKKISRLIKQAKDIEKIHTLVGALQTLAPRLDRNEALSTLDTLRELLEIQVERSLTISNANASSMLNWSIAHSAEALIPRLVESEIPPSQNSLIGVLRKASDDTADAIVSIVSAFGPRLSAEQADEALNAILDAFPRFVDSSELSGMEGVGDLARRLSNKHAGRTLERLVELVDTCTSSEGLLALIMMLPCLQTTPNAAQAEALLDRVLRALKYEDDSHGIWSLVSTFPALAPSLSAPQAHVAARAVFEVMNTPRDVYLRRVVALSIEALVPKLNDEDRALALPIVSSGLGKASRAMEAVAWARALELLVRDRAETDYAQQMVDALKFPTAALVHDNVWTSATNRRGKPADDPDREDPSELLLRRMRDLLKIPLPSQTQGIEETFAQLSEAFPEVSLANLAHRPIG